MLKVIQDPQVAVEHKVDELQTDLSLIRQDLREQTWDWVTEKQDLRLATRGGEEGPEITNSGENPFLTRVWKKRFQLQWAWTAAEVRRWTANDHLVNDMQEEQVLDADLIATPTLFVSAETIQPSQE
ncbi:hypothetical protein NDU88_007833 [Pleurodeles waltl]|uniref:Uncharacterized protein n=1 Tax=Pleurodeles waltl TaxID=8319 RepID=A0AAV7N573_PLEWA|nr:hypothetical protein NDU88_007833 [Pleurodeles waltl]